MGTFLTVLLAVIVGEYLKHLVLDRLYYYLLDTNSQRKMLKAINQCRVDEGLETYLSYEEYQQARLDELFAEIAREEEEEARKAEAAKKRRSAAAKKAASAKKAPAKKPAAKKATTSRSSKK